MQRRRILATLVDVVEDHGYAGLTVASLSSRARVSRRTFYEHFSGCDDCFLQAVEDSLTQARLAAAEAYRAELGWRAGVRAAVATLLIMMDEQPALARLVLHQTLVAGATPRARRATALTEAAAAVDQARFVAGANREAPEITAEGIVGGVTAVIHSRLLSDNEERLIRLHGSLMGMIVRPYLGSRAAEREQSKSPPAAAREHLPRAPRSKDHFPGLTRLTYRTARVLRVIAQHPGAGNREIADAAGITDLGNASRLLHRLERENIIANRGGAQRAGGANSWHLTAPGSRVERAARQMEAAYRGTPR